MIYLSVKYLKSYIGYIVGVLVLTTVQSVIQMVLLMGETKRILDYGVGNGNMNYIYISAVKMILYSLLIGLCTIAVSYMTSKVSGLFIGHLRRDCYEKILSFTPQDFDYFGGATLLTRTTDDPQQVVFFWQYFMSRIFMMPIVILCILVMVYINSRSSFFVLLVAVLLAGLVMVVLEITAKPYFVILQSKIDRLNLLVKEKIIGARSIRAFGNERLEEEKGIRVDEDIYAAALTANRPVKFMNPATLIIINWAIVFIYYLGTNEIKIDFNGKTV